MTTSRCGKAAVAPGASDPRRSIACERSRTACGNSVPRHGPASRWHGRCSCCSAGFWPFLVHGQLGWGGVFATLSLTMALLTSLTLRMQAPLRELERQATAAEKELKSPGQGAGRGRPLQGREPRGAGGPAGAAIAKAADGGGAGRPKAAAAPVRRGAGARGAGPGGRAGAGRFPGGHGSGPGAVWGRG